MGERDVFDGKFSASISLKRFFSCLHIAKVVCPPLALIDAFFADGENSIFSVFLCAVLSLLSQANVAPAQLYSPKVYIHEIFCVGRIINFTFRRPIGIDLAALPVQPPKNYTHGSAILWRKRRQRSFSWVKRIHT